MQELDEKEIDQVSGGLRSVLLGAAGSALWDGTKAAYRALDDHFSKSDTAMRDDPMGRGRHLL